MYTIPSLKYFTVLLALTRADQISVNKLTFSMGLTYDSRNAKVPNGPDRVKPDNECKDVNNVNRILLKTRP